MGDSRPLVTIGIPTRNRRLMLEDALTSALSQATDVEYEVVIADDASTDEEQLRYLRTLPYPNVRVVFRESQGGEAASRNSIIQAMRGDYVLWLDDDDCLIFNALETHVEVAQKNPDAEVVYGNLLRTDAELNALHEYRYRVLAPEQVLFTLVFYSPFPNGSSMIKKSVFEKAGLYDPTHTVGTDYNFWVRAALKQVRFAHNDTFMYLYRSHDSNAALGDEGEAFCDSNSRTLKTLLKGAPLEEIFKPLPWERNANLAKAQALLLTAGMFMRYKHWNDAETQLEQVETLAPHETIFLRALIADIQNQSYSLLQSAPPSGLLGSIIDMCGLHLLYNTVSLLPTSAEQDIESGALDE